MNTNNINKFITKNEITSILIVLSLLVPPNDKFIFTMKITSTVPLASMKEEVSAFTIALCSPISPE